jgi:parallel beta-helix repeat protein
MTMDIRRRSMVAIGVCVLLAGVVALGSWYERQRVAPRETQKAVTVHVTNGGDRGPGTLREALFIVAGATAPTTIALDVPVVKLETALPALVNGNGIHLTGTTAGVTAKAQIDAQALDSGPVFDVSGPNTSIEGVTVVNCPAAAILVRAERFHLADSRVESCDVAVEVAENAGNTLVENNHFAKNRIGIRFGASGHNIVANNEFREDKDAGVWAVRGAADARDAVAGIHDNKFTEDAAGIVAGNIPVLVERNDFVNSHESAVHIVGAGAVIRANQINGGAAMGIVAESASGAVIESNELEGLTAYGVMVRGSADTLVRSNRLHNCGYGLAFVLGDAHKVSSAVENTIIAAKYNGIDVIGDSPILRGNQVLRAHAYALHVEDFQPPGGQKVHSQPYLDNNNFGDSPIQKSSAGGGAAQLPVAVAR